MVSNVSITSLTLQCELEDESLCEKLRSVLIRIYRIHDLHLYNQPLALLSNDLLIELGKKNVTHFGLHGDELDFNHDSSTNVTSGIVRFLFRVSDEHVTLKLPAEVVDNRFVRTLLEVIKMKPICSASAYDFRRRPSLTQGTHACLSWRNPSRWTMMWKKNSV